MLEFSLDENDRTGANLGLVSRVARSDLHPSTSSDDVIHLVFAMRLLRIDTPSRQNIDARAHRRDAKKFKVEFA